MTLLKEQLAERRYIRQIIFSIDLIAATVFLSFMMPHTVLDAAFQYIMYFIGTISLLLSLSSYWLKENCIPILLGYNNNYEEIKQMSDVIAVGLLCRKYNEKE